MRKAAAAIAAIVLSAFFIQAGNGLQTNLIGMTAEAAFDPAIIGVVLACYYAGFSLAPMVGRAVIGRTGHVPAVVVAMLAGAAIVVAMPHWVSAPAWAGFRALSGFSLSLTYVAVESWLNEAVPNAQRGRALSLYMFAQFAGMTLAQILFGMGRAGDMFPFIVSAALLATAGLPVLLFRRAAPAGIPPAPLPLTALFKAAPMGAAATALSGLSWSILFMLVPVYARRIGFEVSGVGWFMGLAVVAGALVQMPAGWISDIAGRRRVLAVLFGGGVAAALIALLASGTAAQLIAAALSGAFVFPLYAVAVAAVNDKLPPETRIAAASGLVLLFGVGSIFGPLFGGWAMAAAGPSGFYVLIGLTMAAGLLVSLLGGRFSARAPAP